MIKIIAVILFLFFCFFMLGDFIKPSVSIYNNSGDVVYLYKATGEKNVEPDIEQAESSMRPLLINNNEYKDVVLSWRDLNLNNGQLYLGWNTKNHKDSASFVSGGGIFDITSDVGYCAYNVRIGHEGETIKPLKGIMCFKKLNFSPGK